MQLHSSLLWLHILCYSYGQAVGVRASSKSTAATTSTVDGLFSLGTNTAESSNTTPCSGTSVYQPGSSSTRTEDVSVVFTSSVANPAALLKQNVQSTATPQSVDPSGSVLAYATSAGTSVVHTYPGGYGEDEAPATYFSSAIVASNTVVLLDSVATASPYWSLANDNQLPTATKSPFLDDTILATTTSDDMSATREGQVPETTEPPNALGVLYSALPSDVASSIASELNIDTTLFLLISDASTTTEPSSQTTNSSSSSTTSSLSSSSTITSTASLSTFSTISRPTSTTSAIASATSIEAPATSSSTQLRQGSIAGIATGVAAGAVLIILTALLLLRRRQQGKPLFGVARKASVRSQRAYPEIAWLYDPEPTPNRTSRHYHRGESEMTLLPTAYEGAAGVAGGDASRGSPDLRPTGQDSPLLPPQMPLVRSDSPGGSGGSSPRSGRGRSARSSLQSVTRMGAIHEEPHMH